MHFGRLATFLNACAMHQEDKFCLETKGLSEVLEKVLTNYSIQQSHTYLCVIHGV